MTIDPGDYDPDELRRLAHGKPGVSPRGPPGGSSTGGGRPEPRAVAPATAALRAAQVEQLFFLQSAVDGLEKPYLRELPASFAAEGVVFDWLDFLVRTGGYRRAYEALRYYRSIGWLAEPVLADLEAYLAGFPGDRDADGSVPADGRAPALDVDDHQLSLVYVARLAAMSD